jgi:hypothetical protein
VEGYGDGVPFAVRRVVRLGSGYPDLTVVGKVAAGSGIAAPGKGGALQHKAARTSPRPALALVLAGSMLVVPALILAHGRQAVARLSTLAVPAAVIPVDRNIDGAATRSVDRYAFAVVDPGPPTTVAAPPATETSITTATTTARVVRTVKRTSTTTTAVRRVAPPRPPPAPTTTVPAHSEVGQASWYNGPTGSCAHPYLPIGTVITVTNVATGASATCTVGGRGPYGGSFIVDLDQATFAKLAPVSAGVVQVRITW